MGQTPEQAPERAPQQAPDSGPMTGPQVIFGLDATGRCTLSTGTGLDLLGVEPGELVGQDLFAVYAGDEASVRSLRRVLAGESFRREREFRGRLLSLYYEPMRDAAGVVTGALGVSTDVTEQRRADAELRAARERAALLADFSAALTREAMDLGALVRLAARSVGEQLADSVTIWLRATPGAELAVRARWQREGGLLPSEEDGADGHGRLHVAEADALDGPRLMDEPAQTSLRVPLRSRGLLLGVLDVRRVTTFTDEEVCLVADLAERGALILDIAMLVEAQEADREELLKFQALADESDNLIGITDTTDRIVYVNPRVRHVAEIPTDDVVAVADAWIGTRASEDIRRCVEETGRWSGDVTIAADGHETRVLLDVFRIFHPETHAELGTAWIARDVTQLRTTQTALRESDADLKQFKALVEASRDFIAIAGLDGCVRYVNPKGRELVGLDPDVDVTTTSIVDYLTPEGVRASLEVEQPAVVAHGHWEGESTLRNRRGPAIPVAIASFLINDLETGEPFALATVQRDLTERLEAEAARRRLVERQRALLARLVNVQDEERSLIAADIHDDPVQAMAAVDLRLALLRRRVQERAPDLVDSLDTVQSSVSAATGRLRALLFDLEPPDLGQGLAGALRRAAGEIFELTGIDWSVDAGTDPDGPEVPEAVRAIAYRIAKEALHNVRKHAGARRVAVTVRGRDGGVEVVVEDDGVGLAPESLAPTPGHRGLATMQDRAAVIGGSCTLSVPAGGGTRVSIWLPGR